MSYRDVDRPSPNARIVGDETDQEILVLAGRLSVLEDQAHDLVAGALGAVPGAVQGEEGVAFVCGGKRAGLVENHAKRRGMRLDQDVGDRDLVGEVGSLALAARV